jgi:hypothetical protein
MPYIHPSSNKICSGTQLAILMKRKKNTVISKTNSAASSEVSSGA